MTRQKDKKELRCPAKGEAGKQDLQRAFHLGRRCSESKLFIDVIKDFEMLFGFAAGCDKTTEIRLSSLLMGHARRGYANHQGKSEARKTYEGTECGLLFHLGNMKIAFVLDNTRK